MQYKRYVHATFTLLLVAVFLAGAAAKLIPALHPLGFSKAFLLRSITAGSFKRPASFQLVLAGMQQSGFLVMIGIIESICCALMAITRTRLLGLLLLLPITFNILTMQAIMNNSPLDIIKCTILLLINLILIAYYYKNILLIWRKMEAPRALTA